MRIKIGGALHSKRSFIVMMTIFCIILVFSIASYFAYMYATRDKNSKNTQTALDSPVANTSQYESATEDAYKGLVSEGRYDEYQAYKIRVAREYYDQSDYANCARLLSEILANVPAKDIDPDVYITYMYLQKNNYTEAGDARKMYGDLLIAALKRENRSDQI